MFTKHINLQNFKSVKNNNNIRKDLKLLLEEKNDVINSLSPKYKYSYPKKFILKLNPLDTNFSLLSLYDLGSFDF